ncbi:hypothetical protein [Fundicoccus culcitae]|uniref:Uncharacterized protein n=1 Tax=Fundicoccus culcitae TaxID=2969821 RepID=A0ABY5P587_9LACT|nr:hypothetical protein [Fundicoccus culcitae]UUX33907.1 hypothetical protein NRE15_13640 [Fundicoccus culcitae]
MSKRQRIYRHRLNLVQNQAIRNQPSSIDLMQGQNIIDESSYSSEITSIEPYGEATYIQSRKNKDKEDNLQKV